MILPRLTPFRLLVPSLIVAAVFVSVQLTQAESIRSLGFSKLRTSDAIKMRRGGCAAFGHSCFGGHGKRSDSIINPAEAEETSTGLKPPTDDVKAFVVNDPSRTPVEIFSRDPPDNELSLLLPSQYQPEEYLRFPPLFRKWLANSYRRGDLLAVNN